jgi:hypothetical protein
VLLAVGFLNTPQRIAWYASEIPPLSFLLDSQSMMVEYGYRYEDEDIGVFRSRFSPEELKQLDLQRGEEVADILDRYIRGEGYKPFQSIYTVPRDAYAHEAGVHLFRRERHFDRAQVQSEKQDEHYDIAYKENLILSKYFTESLINSRHRWNEEIEHVVKNNSHKISEYESPVSAGIITRVSHRQVISLFLIAIFILLSLGFFIGRVSRTTQAVNTSRDTKQ